MKTLVLYPFLFILLLIPELVTSQVIGISGYISNSITEKPIADASVFEAVSGIGTITDNEGFFKLLLRPGLLLLNCLNEGFEVYEKKFLLRKNTTILISLNPVAQNKKTSKRESISQADIQNQSKNQTLSRRKFSIF